MYPELIGYTAIHNTQVLTGSAKIGPTLTCQFATYNATQMTIQLVNIDKTNQASYTVAAGANILQKSGTIDAEGSVFYGPMNFQGQTLWVMNVTNPNVPACINVILGGISDNDGLAGPAPVSRFFIDTTEERDQTLTGEAVLMPGEMTTFATLPGKRYEVLITTDSAASSYVIRAPGVDEYAMVVAGTPSLLAARDYKGSSVLVANSGESGTITASIRDTNNVLV